MPGAALATGDAEQKRQRLSFLEHMFYCASSQTIKPISKQIYTISGSYMYSKEEMGVENDSVCRAGEGKPL